MMEVITLLFALGGGDQPAQPSKHPLLTVRTIYVDRLTGGESAAQMRDMIISSLQSAKLFQVTENPDRADAVLRGAAEDIIFTDRFNSSESLTARASVGGGASGSSRTGVRSAGVTLGQSEATHTQERKHEASAAVRLVDRNGDVIWSTIQESTGGKFRGASADVADRITRQLVSDVTKVRGSRGAVTVKEP